MTNEEQQTTAAEAKKPYDLKELGAKITAEAKKDGLHLAEEAAEKLAKAVYIGTKAWLIESAELSENKVDDFVAPFYNYADQYVLPQIEKLDLDHDGK